MLKKNIIENVKDFNLCTHNCINYKIIFNSTFLYTFIIYGTEFTGWGQNFVTKYSYGYSRHSLPFSPPIFKDRLKFKEPSRGDVIVFKTPSDNRTDYIKRLIGLPGDNIQFINSNLFLK